MAARVFVLVVAEETIHCFFEFLPIERRTEEPVGPVGETNLWPTG